MLPFLSSTRRSQTHLTPLITLLLLAGLLSSCTTAVSETETPASEPVSDGAEPHEKVASARLEALATAQTEVGMPYGKVRQKLIDQGWIPHTIATGGAARLAEPWLREKQMYQLGFDEVVTCSGTGQGYCQFEFVFEDRTVEDGPILAVTTYAASDQTDPSYPEPFFAGLSLRTGHINSDYQQQTLDTELLQRIQIEEAFREPFEADQPVQYAFADAVLLARSYEAETVRMSIFPRQPVSEEQALAYARMLDPEEIMDFEQSSPGIDEDLKMYFTRGYVPGSGPTTTISLHHGPTGDIDEISYVLPMF